MAILLQDDFNRANSTTSLGSPVVGGPYTVVTGTWGINNNEAYLGTPVTGATVTFPAAVNVDISFKQVLASTTTVYPGLLFRYVDTNNHWLITRPSTGDLALWRVAGGVSTQVSHAVSTPSGSIVRVRAYGDQIAWFVNGNQVQVITDQYFATAGTAAGLRSGNASTPRWDDLLVQDQVTPVNNWASAVMSTPTMPDVIGSTAGLTPSLYKGRTTALADESEIP